MAMNSPNSEIQPGELSGPQLRVIENDAAVTEVERAFGLTPQKLAVSSQVSTTGV